MAVIAVFVGSVRNGRHGDLVAQWIANRLRERGHDVYLIDPHTYTDLLVFRGKFAHMESPSDQLKQVQQWLAASDGFVLTTPEYNHSYSGAIKNALDPFFAEYHDKPSAIVTYSSGSFGGVRAAQHLRDVCAELGMPSIPRSLGISKVHELFDEATNPKDVIVVERLDKLLDELEWYMDAFRSKRVR